MKKSVLAVLVLGALLLAGPVAAGPIYSGAEVIITVTGPGGADNGGAFKVTSADSSFDSFVTFCFRRGRPLTLASTIG